MHSPGSKGARRRPPNSPERHGGIPCAPNPLPENWFRSPSSPGKGKRINYTIGDVYLWGFGLELAQFGIDPVTIKKIAVKLWNNIFYTAFGQETDSHQYFFFHPALLGKDFEAELLQSTEAPDGAPHSISHIIARDLDDNWINTRSRRKAGRLRRSSALGTGRLT